MYIPLLYTLGSVIFLASSILFYPQFTADPDIYLTAVCGFVVGSTMFTAAGGMDVWAVMRLQVNDMDAWGAAILSMVGSLLLLAGSLAFWADFGEVSPNLGAHTFRAGSCVYILSCGWTLRAALITIRSSRRLLVDSRWQVGTLLFYIVGAVAFAGGGIDFLPNAAVLHSVLWAFGALMFLIGAAINLFRVWASQPSPLDKKEVAMIMASSELYHTDPGQ